MMLKTKPKTVVTTELSYLMGPMHACYPTDQDARETVILVEGLSSITEKNKSIF